ncbi:ribokinase [Virgibacillus phasianinus]|uniref:Ribokinase n=1 Tax=Virgibacillus phasianinus TaxID=2017483 RepID=A0A220U3B9_9BACI|nr:ribokinase [Virgibacillus phasianinus]ASK62482.1 ribokinase [Virgibacillus phasianinus]
MAKVVIVGSYVVDLMSRTPHMPKAGETVLGGPFSMGPGGKGSNQAVSAARQGADVTMVTKVGNDSFGDDAMANFKKEGIDKTHVTRHTNAATGTALIAVDDRGENMIIVSPGACGQITKEDVLAAEQAFQEADIVLVQLETAMEAVEQAITLAKKYAKPIVLNPAPFQETSDRLLADITYVTPNETEASLMTGIEVTDQQTAQAAAQKLIEKGIDTVIITLGKQGCFVYDGTDEGWIASGFDVDVADTTGAGDAFNGAFATFLASGIKLEEAVVRANAVAALSVTKAGTAKSMPYKHEVDTFISG